MEWKVSVSWTYLQFVHPGLTTESYEGWSCHGNGRHDSTDRLLIAWKADSGKILRVKEVSVVQILINVIFYKISMFFYRIPENFEAIRNSLYNAIHFTCLENSSARHRKNAMNVV